MAVGRSGNSPCVDCWIIVVAPIGIVYGLATTEKKSQVVAITGSQAVKLSRAT
jgi:hypothetical protein